MIGKRLYFYIGVIGSGKNFAAEEKFNECKAYYHRRIDKYGNPMYLGFSDPIRKDVFKLLGFQPTDTSEYENFKNQNIIIRSGDRMIQGNTGRKILQLYGTDIQKYYDKQIWEKEFVKGLRRFFFSDYTDLLCYDCRHIGEVAVVLDELKEMNIFEEMIREERIKFIFCNFKSPRYEISNHESEKFAISLIEKGYSHRQDITEDIINIYHNVNNIQGD